MYKLGLVLVATASMSGCATSAWDLRYGADKPHISYVSLSASETRNDKLYVWNPNNNAAYIYVENNKASACVASADVAKARSTENELKIDIGKILDTVDSAKLEDKLKIVDNITKLGERTEKATYLNVALFHICMLAGAGKLDQSAVRALVEQAIEKSATLGSGTPNKAGAN